MFRVEGEVVDFTALGERSHADLSADFTAAARRALAAFAAPGALEREFPFAFGPAPGLLIAQISLSETLAHGWDLARGAGVPYRPDDRVVDAVARWHAAGSAEDRQRSGMFGPPVVGAADASPFEKLLALLGREA
ncbi:TIGR03086 family metal-binding protein [Saccharomonospora sp. NPDC046836]|uniref:TIGR03086 family metal-binding protein n=1 Tax=Saccharomonospora sp. NPDC046836 TaxID=3156921 RepID=UPI0033D2723F